MESEPRRRFFRTPRQAATDELLDCLL